MKNIYEVNYMEDKNIDERIKNICLQAENNYILNYNIKTTSTNNNNIQNNNKKNEIGDINNYLNDNSELDKTISDSNEHKDFIRYKQNEMLNENYNNNLYSNNNINSKNNKTFYNNSRKNQTFRNNRNITNNNNNTINKEIINSLNNRTQYRSNNMISPNIFNSYNNQEEDDDIVNYNSKLILSQSEIKKNNHNKHCTYTNNTFFSSSPSFCFECDLHNLINDKNIYNKDLSIRTKENKEINKIILTGKTFLVNNKLNKAYNYLKNYINIKNPDLYYLYGETCRKLKFMENAEKYLLLCMNFKNCSPYVYLSLAQLYNEIGQIKYAKQFYKKCLIYFKKGNIFYNLAIIYMKLNKPLKGLNFITEAINLNENVPLYYKLRSNIYKILGHNDLSEKDIYRYNILVNK